MNPFVPLLTVLLVAPAGDRKPGQTKDHPLDTKTQVTVSEPNLQAGKSWQATIGVDGFLYLGLSLQTAYFLDADSLLTASYRNGSDVLVQLLSFSGNTRDSITADTYAVGYKSFLYRNFYYETSLFYQIMQRSSYRDADTDSQTEQASLKADRAGVMFSMGHQWQKKYFTIGCDWIGLALPLAIGEVKTKREVDKVSEEVLAGDQKAFEGKRDSGFLLALRFYLGFSF